MEKTKCEVCGKPIKDGDVGYELHKGTFTETDEGFVYEETVGRYHELCLPDALPTSEHEDDDDDEDED